MQIALLSQHELTPAATAEISREILALCQCAVKLAELGLQVTWLSSHDTAEILASETGVMPTAGDELPATCRHVLACQTYRLGGVQLFCVDPALWQQPDLRTRLFTFLCLLQRQLSCSIWHAWGSLACAYVGVYTARFLGLPAVVSYSRLWLCAGARQTFMWQWVARQVAMALVSSPTDRERLLATSDFVPLRVQVLPPHLSTAGARLVALYRHLSGPSSRHSSRVW